MKPPNAPNIIPSQPIYLDIDWGRLKDRVEQKRQELGVTWTHIVTELGLSNSCIARLKQSRGMSALAFLQCCIFLGEDPFSFLLSSENPENYLK